jgi:hypothetical protein
MIYKAGFGEGRFQPNYKCHSRQAKRKLGTFSSVASGAYAVSQLLFAKQPLSGMKVVDGSAVTRCPHPHPPPFPSTPTCALHAAHLIAVRPHEQCYMPETVL